MEDLSFIFLLCGGIIALPIVAFVLAYFLRRRRGAVLNADLANVIQKQDALFVKPTRLFNIVALILISGFWVLALAMLLTSKTTTLYQLVSIIFSLFLLGAAVVWLVRGLRKPEIEVNTLSRTIRIGQQRTLGFNELVGLYLGQPLAKGDDSTATGKDPLGGIGVVTNAGERVQLATFSGNGYIDRMARFGTLLADAIAQQGAEFNTAFTARDNQPNPSMGYAFRSAEAFPRSS